MHALALLLLSPLAQETLPHAPRVKPPHPLVYNATQAGLQPPSFEGGRTEFEMGDVNGDGRVDIVSVGDHGSPFIGTDQHGVMVWRGDGIGGYSLVMTGDLGYGGVALGDVDGDGLMDVGYGVHHNYSGVDLGDQLLEVARGDGTGTAWTAWDDGLATSGETWGMFGTDFGDVDGDGDLDVGSNSFGCCAGAHVYRNHGDGTWTQSFGFVSGNSDMDFVFCDFDGDGHLDFFSANQDGTAWRGDGAGGFAAADGNLAGSHYVGIAAGDVDGDGADELAYVIGGAPRVFRWTPGDLWIELSGFAVPTPTYDLTQLVDLDVDGHVDLLAFGDGTLTYWRGNGKGAWGPPKSGTTPGTGSKSGEALEAGGDLDHNGYPDIILLQDEGSLFGGGGNEMYALYEASVATSVWIEPVEPSANRHWRGGQARFVTWAAAVPRGADATVKLELSNSGLAGPWTTLASALPNNGRHQLIVPSGIDSAACYLRATITSPSGGAIGVSDRAFRITP